ncbi:hypothetical protein [Nocardiopsis lambiniae]|uniref:Uncharacterized protein n=1 Tax=Nocardiopsis lambiniae TaxID=3075539 RepID=A0ABU2M5R6_9ACTN|nr:hypothetical protein [Nocardiopsis sp. DSM 44743]MDT0327336.1 hypothetical protein [Nocardiopsis sp. DSM 44743]
MEQWVTKEDVFAARERLEADHEGWERPVAFAVGRLRGGDLHFPWVNRPGALHALPAIVLARALGHVRGTATHDLPVDRLREAVEALSPAEACTEFDHPNLFAWRDLLVDLEDTDRFVAVFVADPADPAVDDHDVAFRRAIGG